MDYVLFLRGINVNGIKVPMAELKDCLIGIGLGEVKTYLQTGNVVFTSPEAISELKPRIEKALSQRFGYTAFVLLFPFSMLQKIRDDCPFEEREGKHRYVVFCESQAIVDELATFGPELDAVQERIASGFSVLYWQLPKGSSTETTFSKIVVRSKYRAITTTRNYNTIEKIAAK